MNYRNLIHGYVVDLILSFPTHCKFPNYGGKEDGLEELHARILNSFNIPETGHLQTCYTGKRLSMKKVVDLITELVDKDQLEDVIDVWKEICNHSDSSDLRLMGYCQEIEQIGIKNGYGPHHFLHIVAPVLKYSQFSSIEDFFKQAVAHTERAISARSIDGCNYHIDKLKRVLVTCPCIQAYFIGEMFDQKLLDELTDESTPSERTDIVVSKIKLSFEINSNKEGTKKMHENMKAMHEEKKEESQVWQKETIYEGKERFVHFMGTEHLTQTAIVFTQNEKRIDQECKLVHEAMLSLIKENNDSFIGYLKAFIKSVIHRSYDQETICRDILIEPGSWEAFVKTDPRKRGMLIDVILDETANFAKPEVETQPEQEMNSEKPQSKVTISGDPSHPLTQELAKMLNIDIKDVKPAQQENKESEGMGKYLDIIKELHPDLWSELIQRQVKGEQLTEEIINEEVLKVATSNMFGINPVVLKKLGEDADIVTKLEALVDQMNLSFEALTGVGVDQLKEFLVGKSPMRRTQPAPQENFSSENITRGLDFPFTLNTECDNPTCPVHGDQSHERQQRPADMIIGIQPIYKGGAAFIVPGSGKHREEGQHDFSSMRKFLSNYFDPKVTATEIETEYNDVYNQSFIINDANGEFFCEYKMVWTSVNTRYMVSHQKPGTEGGRRFHVMDEFGGKLSYTRAVDRFKTIRELAIKDPHQPKGNPFKNTQPVTDEPKVTEPKVGTEVIMRVVLIDMIRHELLFNKDTNRMTISGNNRQQFSGVVEDEHQANFVWERYKKGVVIGAGNRAIAVAIAELNNL